MTAYLEKASLNYANAFSMQKDLGLKGREYSWTVSIASLGMLIGAYPSSLAIQKFPLGKMMSILLFTWGLFSMSLAGAKNFGGIFTLRFLLGLSESTINPAWVILSSMFWTRDEQPLRMCIWLGCNGLADIIGAGLAVGLGSVTDTAIRAWQLIFLASLIIHIFPRQTNSLAGHRITRYHLERGLLFLPAFQSHYCLVLDGRRETGRCLAPCEEPDRRQTHQGTQVPIIRSLAGLPGLVSHCATIQRGHGQWSPGGLLQRLP